MLVYIRIWDYMSTSMQAIVCLRTEIHTEGRMSSKLWVGVLRIPIQWSYTCPCKDVRERSKPKVIKTGHTGHTGHTGLDSNDDSPQTHSCYRFCASIEWQLPSRQAFGKLQAPPLKLWYRYLASLHKTSPEQGLWTWKSVAVKYWHMSSRLT